MILAIEIGGTKLQVAVAEITETTELLERVRLPVERKDGASGILRQLEPVVRELASRHALTSCGVGFGGPVDVAGGLVITSHQVAGWDGFALAQWLHQRWPLSVYLGNDCNVAALAEATLGAGRGLNRVLFVTVGTGIGGGLVIDRQIDGHSRPAIAELGHLRPGLQAQQPDETVEALASGLGIERRARAALDSPSACGTTEALAGDLRRHLGTRPLTAQSIALAASAGQLLARELIDSAAQVLGWALAQATTLMAPERIVIGGGVSLIGDTYLAEVQRAWKLYVFPPLAACCDLVPAQLGEDVVLHGAAQLARSFARCSSESLDSPARRSNSARTSANG